VYNIGTQYTSPSLLRRHGRTAEEQVRMQIVG
jgi:hypothetical protein